MRFNTILLGLLFSVLTAMGRDDIQSWQWVTVDFFKNDSVRGYLYADNRIAEDASQERVFIVGPRFSYRAQPWLDLGVGYVYIDVRNLNSGNWRSQHRLELEFNPYYMLTDTIRFQFRNRLEARWIEDRDPVSYRSRHRFALSKKLGFKWLKSVYCNNEFFYRYDLDQYNENRAVPIGLGFKLNKHLGLNLFYMIQSVQVGKTDEWNHNHILGTHLKIKF